MKYSISIAKYIGIGLMGLCLTLGVSSCKKDNNDTPVASSEGISPDSASGGNLLTLTGSGLGGMVSIVFDNGNVPAGINTNFNTDNAILFRVPDTAYGGEQNIIFTKSNGQVLKVPFKVLALATVTSVSTTDFVEGTTITLTGNNLDDVSSVVFTGTSTEATVVEKAHRSLVIKMPAFSGASSTLDITNGSGTITTSQKFVYLSSTQNFQWFLDALGTGVDNWSWATTSVSTAYAVTGTSSFQAVFSSGAWAGVSLHAPSGLSAADYTTLAFWIRGGTSDEQVDVSIQGGSADTKTITVPAGVWTHFSYPISGWANTVTSVSNLQFQIQGPTGDAETLYFDNILFIK